jgi:dipeptidyl aminopeptidase/acylaminoacyl peptidase
MGRGVAGFVVCIGLTLVATPAHAAFPGVNGKIAFERVVNGNMDVYTMEPDGSTRTRLTKDSAADGYPAFSPDGSRIAFARPAFSDDADVWIMNADGSGQTRLTSNTGADREPAFSPDGSKIAFTSTRDGNSEVYVMNADGSGQTRLTDNPAVDISPVFSPDGSQIAFTRRVAEDSFSPHDLYLMDADGADVAPLTNDGKSGEPAFSPDGSQIAFTSIFVPPYPAPFLRLVENVFVMNADGSGRTQLTGVGAPASARSPAFSPDGSRIAFAISAGGFAAVWTMNPDGSDVDELPGDIADFRPDWGVAYTSPSPPHVPPIARLPDTVHCPQGTSASVVCHRDRHGKLVMVGTGADETFLATNGDDLIYAMGGDDVIRSWSGEDWVYGGRGADHIRAGGGDDHAYGGSGDDIVSGGSGADQVKGAAGADRLTGGRGADSLNGGSGDDRLNGGSDADRVDCGPGTDRARNTPLDDVAGNCELR